MNEWDRIVFRAWLERNDSQSQWWHPAKADLIYARFHTNIERAERYVTAEGMIERYKYSDYTPYQRASNHATSYESNTRQYRFWTDVCNIIKHISAQESKA
jgi:hypothetical protein